MPRRLSFALLVVALSILIAVPVSADGPTFDPAFWADGEMWSTKGLRDLPPPNDHNEQSFDKLYMFTNGPQADGLPLSEAAPGNPAYNGGRWWVVLVEWDAPHPAVVLKSFSSEYVDDPFESFEFHDDLGHLKTTETNIYFECPLLPVK